MNPSHSEPQSLSTAKVADFQRELTAEEMTLVSGGINASARAHGFVGSAMAQGIVGSAARR